MVLAFSLAWKPCIPIFRRGLKPAGGKEASSLQIPVPTWSPQSLRQWGGLNKHLAWDRQVTLSWGLKINPHIFYPQDLLLTPVLCELMFDCSSAAHALPLGPQLPLHPLLRTLLATTPEGREDWENHSSGSYTWNQLSTLHSCFIDQSKSGGHTGCLLG